MCHWDSSRQAGKAVKSSWQTDSQSLEYLDNDGSWYRSLLHKAILTVLQVAVPFAQIVDQEVLDQGFCIVVETLRKVKFPFQNILVNNQRVVICKGVNPCNHLVNQNPQSPPVNWFSVTLVLQNFRGQILRSSTKSESSIFYNFSKAEVCEFEISISID